MQISNDAMDKIAALLSKRCGWDLTTADYKRLQMTIVQLQSRQGLDDNRFMSELLACKGLQQQLVDEMVIPETYFFRYSKSYQYLKQLAAQWLAKNKSGIFRVASIPSATGEEAYSIAMTLHEAGIPLQRLAVDAMDVSAPLVARSRQGIYSSKCLARHRLVEPTQYFDVVAGGLQVKQIIRERVNFKVGNVKRLPADFFRYQYPIIFCRNLLIYLSDDVRLALFKQLKSMLQNNGKLFVGPAEVNYFLQQGMDFIDKSQAFMLQFPSPARANEAISKGCFSGLEKNSSATKQVKKPKQLQQPQPFKVTSVIKIAASTADKPNVDLVKLATKNVKQQLADIRKLADSNDLNAAHQRCQALLSEDKSVSAFLLQGEILLAMGDLLESAQAMKKALYIEPGNEQALAHLVLLCRRRGDLSEASRYQQCLDGIRGQA